MKARGNPHLFRSDHSTAAFHWTDSRKARLSDGEFFFVAMTRADSARGASGKEWHVRYKPFEAVYCCLTALVAVVSVGMGLVFGFAMEKGSVHVPSVIRDQMLFSSNRMLSMFLSAAGTSALVIAILKLVRAPTEDAFKEYSTHAKRGGLSLLLGGLILGLGMQLSGSCPGTVWIQAGGLVPKFHLVWAGGLTAALVFSYIHPTLQQSGLFEIGRDFIVRHPQLPDPYGITGFLVAAFFWGVVGIVHLLDPPAVSHGGNVLTQAMWHPAMAGLFVGLLELPAALVWKELFGSSQSYVTLISNLLASVGARSNEYLQKYRSGIDNFNQVFFMLGAVAGAMTSTFLGHGWAGSAVSSPVAGWESFLGGFLLVGGARFAAGCTSGHGISGMGSLAIGSFIAVAGMFGGAIMLGVARAILHV